MTDARSTNDTVEITKRQRDIHTASEAFAVAVVAPFLIYAGTRKRKLTQIERNALVGIGIATLVVDGYLLSKYT
jgi:hypothetical protein